MHPIIETEEVRRPRRVVDRITIALFMLVLCLPLAGELMHVNVALDRFDSEMPQPEWRWSWRYPRELEAYFNTHFPFREYLTSLHAQLMVRGLGLSSSQRVTLGTNGWLFYSGEQIVDDFRRVRPFADADLAQWTRLLVARRDSLRARGIPFLFMVAPNTQTIYPEYMPEELAPIAGPSRLDQLMQYLKAHSDLDVLDVRPALRAAKQNGRVCYMTDSHWNQLAGFVVYQQLSRWLRLHFPQLRTFTMADFDRIETHEWRGGLSYFLGDPSLYSETRVDFTWKVPAQITSDGKPLTLDETNDAWVMRRRVVRESADGEIGTAVFLRDSQLAAPMQFLSRHFRRSVLFWTKQFDARAVFAEHPDVVVEEFVERRLMDPIPVDDALL